ncbi:MAG TPA: hypothetical protein VHE14_01005, partial [Solirubrobacteraceae bacterium]|nr:hypothetical protein [Solirubrobacteraceae bacterium]
MSPVDFEIERFEQVPATPGRSLVRITGRWRADGPQRLGPAALLIDDGRRTHRLDPLPGPGSSPAGGGAWQAAFSVPTDLMRTRAAFALEAGAGALVDLPRPTERGGRLRRAAAPVAAPAPPVAKPVAPPAPAPVDSSRALRDERRLREDAERLAEQRRQAMAELERSLEAERAARAEAVAQAHAEATARAKAETAAARGGQGVRELEQALAELTQERETADRRAAEAERAMLHARDELGDQLSREHTAVSEARDRAEEAQRAAAVAAEETARERGRVRDSVRAGAEQLERAQAQIAALTAEREQLSERGEAAAARAQELETVRDQAATQTAARVAAERQALQAVEAQTTAEDARRAAAQLAEERAAAAEGHAEAQRKTEA